MKHSEEASVSRAADAAAVAAERGRLRYYLEGQSTGVGRYILEQAVFFFLRGMPSLVGIGLLYATSNEGGNHTIGNTIQGELNGIPEPMDPLITDGKAEYVKIRQDETAFVEACGLCVFPYMLIEDSMELLAELYSATVGEHYTEADIR